jgi:hypothetical protein
LYLICYFSSAPFLSERYMAPIERINDLISFAPSPAAYDSLTDDEWDSIVVTAIALGLAPLLYRCLSQTVVSVPPMAMAKLAVTWQAHAKRNAEIADQLAEILAACARHNIKVLTLKGALLAPVVYDEAALRPMNDIDLLFAPEDLSQVAPVLESLGYVGRHKSSDQGPGVTKHVSTYRRVGNEGSTPNPYLSASADRTVEPHGSLEESWFGLTADITPGVWARAVPMMLHGQPTYRLSATDMLLHLAVHAAFHVIMGASVFLQLYDIGQVVKVWWRELDWSQLLASATIARAQPFVYASLHWARTIYKVPLTDAPLSQLESACQSDLVAYVKSLDAVGLFERTQQPPLITLKQRLQRGLSDRKEAARWASSLGAKWRVWQTALAFHKTDTASLFKQRLRVPA